jgi:hypothetical protein
MICSGVPIRPLRRPRFETLYSSSDSRDSSWEPSTKSWYDAYASGEERTSRMRSSSDWACAYVSRQIT